MAAKESADGEMRKMVLAIANHLIELCPDEAMPFLVSKFQAKETISSIANSLSGRELAEMCIFTFESLERLFNEYGKDYIRSKALGQEPKFKELQDALKKIGIWN